jgi:glutamate dehydrogenase (NAD(P)+)
MGLEPGLQDKEFIVQGFGNVGYWSAKFLCGRGSKLVAVIERDGAIEDRNGISPDALKAHMLQNRGRISTYSTSSSKLHANPMDGLELACSVLIPAALEKQITGENADRIKAKLIAEAANGPLTPEADQILNAKGDRIILPDMWLNAGGVTVSYFEWLMNISAVRFGRLTEKWEQKVANDFVNLIEDVAGKKVGQNRRDHLVYGATEADIVKSGLKGAMLAAFAQIVETANAKKIDLRTAAYVTSIEKIARSYENSDFIF